MKYKITYGDLIIINVKADSNQEALQKAINVLQNSENQWVLEQFEPFVEELN